MDNQHVEDICKEKILPLKNDYIKALKHRAKHKYKGRVWCVDPITYDVKTFKNNMTAYLMGYYCYTEERFAIVHKLFYKEVYDVISKTIEESINEKIELFVDVKDIALGDSAEYVTSNFNDEVLYKNVKMNYNGAIPKVKL